MERKKSRWVTGPLDKAVPSIPPHNASPNMGQFDGRSGDNINRTDLAKVLPDDEEFKTLGVPTFGGIVRYGSCTMCRNPMYLSPTALFCPHCRRMLTIQTPPYSLDPGPDGQAQTDGGMPEDSHKTPSRSELRENLDQYIGGYGDDFSS